MKRIALFAHFDPDGSVQPHTLTYLQRLREACVQIVFASTSPLGELELARLRPHVSHVLQRENVGFDFGMWQHALANVSLAGFDELVLTNSSVIGPVVPLVPVFERMKGTGCDFWGMTDNHDTLRHLQSYFLVFNARTFRSEEFGRFWQGVLPYRDKRQVILSYELGLSTYLEEQGFTPAAFASIDAWATPRLRARMARTRRWDPTLFFPHRLLELGMPFVKIALLRKNVGNVPLKPVIQALVNAGFPEESLPRLAQAVSWYRRGTPKGRL